MGTQPQMALSEPQLGSFLQLSAHELQAWNVSQDIRDHFRRVRSTLSLTGRQTSHCVAVCSTCRGEGVSWVTAMLGCAIAEETEPILLIDCNRAHPSQRKIFSADQQAADQATQSDPLSAKSPRGKRFEIAILTPSADSSTGQDLGRSLREVLPKLRQKHKVILIDCEPIRESSQLLDLAPALDGVIFVVETERERREVVARSLESIDRARLPLLGIILNKRRKYIPDWLYRAL